MSRLRDTKWADLLAITLDVTGPEAISRQIQRHVRLAILAGKVALGSRMPSSRELATLLGVSRNAVITAYEELLAEGFLEGRPGSGTFVTLDAPPQPRAASFAPAVGTFTFASAPTALPVASSPPMSRRLSDAGLRYQNLAAEAVTGLDVPFSTGRTAIDAQSIDAWRRLSAVHQHGVPSDALGYGDPFGRYSLREVVAEYLLAFRGVNCRAEQVMITSGAQQAIDLSIRVLLNPGDQAWVEDPGYPATLRALRAAGMTPIPVPVDGQGLVVSRGVAVAPTPRAIFVTPAHQFPSGTTLSMTRRLELLAAARRADAWLLEDDYDSEFRYSGRPILSLQGIDQDARVIYVGTLSKVMFPGLRTGFVVLPPDLVDAYRGARYLTDRGPPIYYQATLEDFMREGFFSRHIWRMRKHYRQMRDALVADLRTHLGDLATVHEPECGMRVLIDLAEGIDDTAVVDEAARRGVIVRAISPLFVTARPRSGLDLGFTGFQAEPMRQAARRLGEAVREVAGRPEAGRAVAGRGGAGRGGAGPLAQRPATVRRAR